MMHFTHYFSFKLTIIELETHEGDLLQVTFYTKTEGGYRLYVLDDNNHAAGLSLHSSKYDLRDQVKQ